MAACKNSYEIQKGAEALVSCAICADHFKSPKVLPCQHTFCLPCLRHYYNSCNQQRIMHVSNFPCPSCRKMAFVPQGGIESFPTDFKVTQIQDFLDKINISGSKAKGSTCDVCCHDSREAFAHAYCMQCCKYLCVACLEPHRRSSVFREHSTVELAGADDLDMLGCREHGEDVRYFCMECEVALCTVCALVQHADHRMEDLQRALEHRRRQINRLLQQIRQRVQHNARHTQRLELLLDEHDQRFQETRRRVGEQEAALVASVQTQAADTIRRLDTTHRDTTKELAKVKENLHSAQESLSGLYDKAQDILLPGQAVRLLADGRDFEERMRRAAEGGVHEIPATVTMVSRFEACEAEPALGTLVHEEAAAMTAALPPSPPASPVVFSDAEQGDQDEVFEVSDGVVTASTDDVTTNDVDSDADSNPDAAFAVADADADTNASPGGPYTLLWANRDLSGITDVTFRPDGEIIAAECSHRGNKLHLVDRADGSYRALLTYSNVINKPWGVAMNGSATSVIVTDHGDSCVKILDPQYPSSPVWRRMFHKPCGVAVMRSGEFVITDCGDRRYQISIHLPTGLRVCEFAPRGRDRGQLMTPSYVAIDHRDRIVVSDTENNCVKIFDRQGTELLGFSADVVGGGGLMRPQGVSVTSQDDIVVADQAYGGVTLYSAEGEFIRHIVHTDGCPQSVATDPADNLLVSTSTGLYLYSCSITTKA